MHGRRTTSRPTPRTRSRTCPRDPQGPPGKAGRAADAEGHDPFQQTSFDRDATTPRRSRSNFDEMEGQTVTTSPAA